MAKKRDPLVALLDKEATELLAAANGDKVELKERQSIFREVVRYLGVKNKLDLFDEETDGGIAGIARALSGAPAARTGPGRAVGVPATADVTPTGDGIDHSTLGVRHIRDHADDRDDPGRAFAATSDSVGSGRLGADGDDEPEPDDDGGARDLLRTRGIANGLA